MKRLRYEAPENHTLTAFGQKVNGGGILTVSDEVAERLRASRFPLIELTDAAHQEAGKPEAVPEPELSGDVA